MPAPRCGNWNCDVGTKEAVRAIRAAFSVSAEDFGSTGTGQQHRARSSTGQAMCRVVTAGNGSIVQAPDSVPANKSLHSLIFGKAELIEAACRIRIAILCALPEFPGIRAGKERAVLL